MDFPEIRGFPFLNHHLGAQVVWGRYNLTRQIHSTFKQTMDPKLLVISGFGIVSSI